MEPSLQVRQSDIEFVHILIHLASYNQVIDRVQKILKKAGKDFFTFAVGKLNPAKLANFAEVDVFILISCPQCSIIDTKEYFRPIATPYELDIALKGDSSELFNSSYSLHFASMVHRLNALLKNLSVAESVELDGQVTVDEMQGGQANRELTVRSNGGALIASTKAINVLQGRTWTGLDVLESQKPVTMAVQGTTFFFSRAFIFEGRIGVARNYTHEIRYEDD